jgi:hypothetical protein
MSHVGSSDPQNMDGDIKVDAFSLGANYWLTKHLRFTLIERQQKPATPKARYGAQTSALELPPILLLPGRTTMRVATSLTARDLGARRRRVLEEQNFAQGRSALGYNGSQRFRNGDRGLDAARLGFARPADLGLTLLIGKPGNPSGLGSRHARNIGGPYHALGLTARREPNSPIRMARGTSGCRPAAQPMLVGSFRRELFRADGA